uniref:Uncharacterized protein n=1 Tax=Rhizobium leguminosarum TaxID=384 RepID=A0A179BF04_RHILE|nr:hypothetical protein A4U53_30255 [Rhizobium leguminosarum]
MAGSRFNALADNCTRVFTFGPDRLELHLRWAQLIPVFDIFHVVLPPFNPERKPDTPRCNAFGFGNVRETTFSSLVLKLKTAKP